MSNNSKADVKAAEALVAEIRTGFANADLDGKKSMLGLFATQMVKEAISGDAPVDGVKRALGDMIGLTEYGCNAFSLGGIVRLMDKCGIHITEEIPEELR